MGSTLSGGQKQRVLIARALYRKPQMLFIDEGTAHLDPKTEENLMTNLAKLGITRITIAHRSEAISNTDRAFLVGNGTVQELRQQDHNQKGSMHYAEGIT